MLASDHVQGGTDDRDADHQENRRQLCLGTDAKLVWSDDMTLANADDRTSPTVSIPALAAGDSKQLTVTLNFDRVELVDFKT